MTVPGGMPGGDGPGDIPELMKRMFGGDVPPPMAMLLQQFATMTEGMSASTQALKTSVALNYQRASAQVAEAEARCKIAEAQVALYTARLRREYPAEERAVIEAELAAAEKMLEGSRELLTALRELEDLARTEALSALGADPELFAKFFGKSTGTVPGDDLIKPDPRDKPTDS